MGIEQNGAVRRNLRTLFNLGVVRELTDGQLLERFANDPGEVSELAFAAIVERHGPMVLRVCRGVLGDRDEAHDAFQATFLVLVRRARGLWVRDSIGPWLHQVAYRTASCARSRAARHRRLERKAARDEAFLESNRDIDLERILHEEINRLPDRFRSVVVLCDLEGRSYEQAAHHLGWPVGTVKSRLSRGRECLRDRLIGRGLGQEGRAVIGGEKLPAVLVPVSLLDAATAAATRYAAIGSGLGGASVTLAEGVLRTMTISQWWKVAAALVVAGATASGAGWGGSGPGGQDRPDEIREVPKNVTAGDVLTFPVHRANLEFIESSRGSVEAGRSEFLTCNIEGETTIVDIVPEGRMVKKGTVVARLDSTTLKAQLATQEIVTRGAEADFVAEQVAKAVAEAAAKEYAEGLYKQELAALQREAEGHRDVLHKIEMRLDRTIKAREQVEQAVNHAGKAASEVVTLLDIQDRVDDVMISRDRERRALADAEGRLDVLSKFTREKVVLDLEGQVKKATALELARKTAWELEKRKEQKIQRQVEACRLVAPIDGVVVYANDPSHPGKKGPQIDQYARVRERQIIAYVVDLARPMQINLKVPEAWVHRISPKMRARIKVDAFHAASFEGQVVSVAPLPDPLRSPSQEIKLYTAHIRLDRPFPDLRPGMTASAEIVTARRENILAVPIEAFRSSSDLAVKRPDGAVEWREVVVGFVDSQKAEIKEGLREGDEVILDPSQYMEARGRRGAVTSAGKKAARRKGA